MKRVSAWAGLLFLLALVPALGAGAATDSPTGARMQAPARWTGGARFLTLPFTDPQIVVQQGWLYSWGSQHGGTDYVLGGRDTGKWRSFDVVAAADGWACGNCTSRQGNAVWIKHQIGGQTYYTYYGHLAAIEPSIPIGNQRNVVWVQRGQKLGVSGSTGADSVHLHFQVNLPSGPVDPYDLWSTREPYMPGCGQCALGTNTLWSTNPPGFADGTSTSPADAEPPVGMATPTTPARPTVPPTATATPSPTPKPCDLAFEQTVEGTLSDGNPDTGYCIKAKAGEWLSVRMFTVNNSTLDTLLKLYTPDGTLLATDDDGAQVGGNSFLVKQLPQSGTYRLTAGRYGGEGAYRLRAEQGPKSALGDLNRDCKVDATDLRLMIDALGSRDPNADLNLDGGVDTQDHTILTQRLGRGCTP